MCKINPRVDFAFKKLFGSEDNKDLLISLINSIVSEEDQVADLILKNPYNFENYYGGKLSILDIKAKSTTNVWFNIEMQIGDDYHFDKRSLYYWSQLIDEQVPSKGMAYKLITKTICINFLDFNIAKKTDEDYHSIYKILNTKTKSSDGLHEILEMHYVELQRFKKEYEEIATVLDRWVTFLTKANELDKNNLNENLIGDKNIAKAIQEVDKMFNEEEREVYLIRRKEKMDKMSLKASAEEKGMKKGIKQVAEKMLNKGMDINDIMEITGLSEKDITNIKKG